VAVRVIVTDIEGTTSAVSFVVDVLFPYAAEHLPAFVHRHAGRPDVAA
jgi:enolase-phosphatase E1